jgi:hypothetical protein
MKEDNNKSNTFTTVKTSYARAALVLLALNFCLTGYVILNMHNATQDILNSQPPTELERVASGGE